MSMTIIVQQWQQKEKEEDWHIRKKSVCVCVWARGRVQVCVCVRLNNAATTNKEVAKQKYDNDDNNNADTIVCKFYHPISRCCLICLPDLSLSEEDARRYTCLDLLRPAWKLFSSSVLGLSKQKAYWRREVAGRFTSLSHAHAHVIQSH